jgi:hypothetical protein
MNTPPSSLLKNKLLSAAGCVASKIKHGKCLIFGARREFTSRRSELKKAMEDLFQQPARVRRAGSENVTGLTARPEERRLKTGV